MKLLHILPFIGILLAAQSSYAATSLPFTVTMSEPVIVTGCPSHCPRLVLDVGGVTRYADFASGSGTSILTFTYATQAGDVDLDGITISSSSIDLNTSGAVIDLNGNPATLTFSAPNTTGLKVDYPSMAMDFIGNDYILNGAHYASLPGFLTAAGGSFARTSIGTYFDSSGVMQTAASGTPRFDYDPVTHVAKGILIEETRTNLLLRSAELNNAYWTQSLVTVSVDTQTSPDGTRTAEKVIEDTSASTTHDVRRGSLALTVGATYTYSVYIKAAERSWVRLYVADNPGTFAASYYYDVSSGSLGSGGSSGTGTTYSGSISSVGNGWYRCVLTFTFTTAAATRVHVFLATGNNGAGYTGNGTSGLYVWGEQLEQGSFPTSYIPTTAAAVTRQIDVLSLPIGGWYTALQSTLYSDGQFYSINTSKEQTMIDMESGGGNQILLWKNKTGQQMEAMPRVAFVNQTGSLASSSSVVANTRYRTAAAYKTNDFAIAFDGGGLKTASSGTLITPTNFYVGTVLGTTGALNGALAAVKYYPARVANTQLQLLTQ